MGNDFQCDGCGIESDVVANVEGVDKQGSTIALTLCMDCLHQVSGEIASKMTPETEMGVTFVNTPEPTKRRKTKRKP